MMGLTLTRRFLDDCTMRFSFKDSVGVCYKDYNQDY